MFAVFWLVEIFTDAEWPTNKQHRKPTSIAIHLSMELRLHGANLLFLCPQLQVNFIAWCQVVWMESTSKHAWNFWLARKLNSSNGLTTARQDSWFGDFSCIETWTKSLPARWWIRNASKIQNLMLTVLQTTRDGSCWDRSTVEKLRNRTCLLVTEMADTARQQGRRNSADRFHAVAAIYQKKNMQIFFLAKWVFRGKCWNDATKTGKSQMVNRWSKLTNSRRSAWNFHSWTWDNMGWLPHIEMSASSFLTPQPGPFWLKSFAARFAVRVHFFRAVEIGFMVYLHLVNFFRIYLNFVGFI